MVLVDVLWRDIYKEASILITFANENYFQSRVYEMYEVFNPTKLFCYKVDVKIMLCGH